MGRISAMLEIESPASRVVVFPWVYSLPAVSRPRADSTSPTTRKNLVPVRSSLFLSLVRNERAWLRKKMASSRLVLPAALLPRIPVPLGSKLSSAVSMRLKFSIATLASTPFLRRHLQAHRHDDVLGRHCRGRRQETAVIRIREP